MVEGLSVITSGNYVLSYPTDLLNSLSMGELLQQLSSQTDLTLIDSPPILPLADAGVLLVLNYGSTRQADVRQGLENLEQMGASLVGVVLNTVPMQISNYNYYYQLYATPLTDGVRNGFYQNPLACLLSGNGYTVSGELAQLLQHHSTLNLFSETDETIYRNRSNSTPIGCSCVLCPGDDFPGDR